MEEIDDLTGQQYFVEEAARDIFNNEHYDHDVKDFNKLLQYIGKFLRLLLSVGRLCDDWRRRPIQGTLHFVQRHEQDLKYISTRTKTLLFITCMLLLMTLLRSNFATHHNHVEKSRTLSTWRTWSTMEAAEEDILLPLTELSEHNIAYLSPIEGDPPNDRVRLQQMKDINDESLTTCHRLSTRTLRQNVDEKKLKNQNMHTGQETHYEQYMTTGMTLHDTHMEENDDKDERNKVDHNTKDQKQYYMRSIKHYSRWSLSQDAKDFRQRDVKKHKKHDLQKDSRKHHQ
eukprot:6265163-Amphidinium_carterae.1